MRNRRIGIAAGMLVLFGILAAGCATRSTHQASSVMQYLYSGKQQMVEPAPVAHLTLPLRVGIAFVPGGAQYSTRQLSEKEKMDLLTGIGKEFKGLPFVKSIEIIPSPYLTPQGSFTNLDQIRTMYGIDVIALVSYDQVQHTDQGLLSLSYWTLVGAYVVKGEKNDTSTMLDAAVYHIPSRKFLFRAPGTSQIKGAATPVNLSEQLRLDAQSGFAEAAANLVENLKVQLELFKEKVKETPDEYRVTASPTYRGGGSVGGLTAFTLVAAGGIVAWYGRKERR
ncbi:MAG: rhombotarget lipoprotein [Desulfuromonadales bacterium]|nr:MAG: rhombotarget lipoprotein [Desulfuromonadales bacterium]